jgi:hypothetical protein
VLRSRDPVISGGCRHALTVLASVEIASDRTPLAYGRSGDASALSLDIRVVRGVSVMTVVLRVGVLMLTVMGAWLSHRRVEMLAWNRELDDAFASRDRREMPPHRAL